MKTQSINKKIWHMGNLLLVALTLALFMSLSSTFFTLKASALCGSADACDRAATTCRTDGGTWDPSTTTCSGATTTSGGTTNSSSNNIPDTPDAKSDCKATGSEDNDASNCGIVGLLNTVFNFVSGGIALAVIGNIIFAGIQYSIAQGDPSTASKAKKRISGALIAFLMYLGLYGFLQWLIPGGVF